MLTLTVHLKLCESHEHPIDHVRVSVLTSTLASAMITPVNGRVDERPQSSVSSTLFFG